MRRLVALAGLIGLLGSPATGRDRDYRVIAREAPQPTRTKEVLFFGRQDADIPDHNPPGLFAALEDEFEQAQINLTFSNDLADLSASGLAGYDAVMLYGNTRLNYVPQVSALIDFVERGGGFVGVHVASWTFPTSAPYGALIGGRFRGHHATSEYSQTYGDVYPPILAGLAPYTSSDEPYLHKEFQEDIRVISWRNPVSAGEIATDYREPYTWVRTQGLGRVFYHAGGHTPDTWSQQGFTELLARGVHWVSDNHAELGIPQVSGDGTVLFEGDSDSSSTLLAGRSSADLAAIARDGEASPVEIGGGAWALPPVENPRLVDGGGVALIAPIEDGVGGATLKIVREQGGQFEELLADGDLLPALGSGLTVILDPPASSPHMVASEGSALARVALGGATAAVDTAVLRLDGETSTVVAREGDQVPTLAAGVVFGDLSSIDLSMAEDGSWACVVDLAGAGVTAADDRAIIHADAAGAISVLREGAALSGQPGVFLGEISECRVSGSGRVIFNLMLTGAVTAADDAGLVRWLPGSAGLVVLVRDGATIGGAALRWVGAGDSWACNQDGEAIIAALMEGAGITQASNEGIWFADGTSLLNLALEGGQVPREPLGTLYAGGLTSAPLCLGEGPTAAFRAAVTGVGAPGDAVVAGSLGALGIVLREGDQLRAGGVTETIVGLSLGSAGSGSSLTGHHLVMRADTAGGGAAIVAVEDVRDLDGDTVADSLELAFGTDPDLASDGQSGLPQIVSAGGETVLEFRRQAQPSSLVYLLEESPDLVIWSPSTAIQELAADQSGLPAGFERIQASGGEELPRRFFRLSITIQ
ncbi:MAG: ThuA domain-containing protein [Verrucomicrobiales bacterium]